MYNASVNIMVVNDTLTEEDERFQAVLSFISTGINSFFDPSNTADITIVDDDSEQHFEEGIDR